MTGAVVTGAGAGSMSHTVVPVALRGVDAAPGRKVSIGVHGKNLGCRQRMSANGGESQSDAHGQRRGNL